MTSTIFWAPTSILHTEEGPCLILTDSGEVKLTTRLKSRYGGYRYPEGTKDIRANSIKNICFLTDIKFVPFSENPEKS